MLESTILKNKKLNITVLFAEKQKANSEKDYSKIIQAEIQRDLIKENYIEVGGFAQKEGSGESLKISLTDFILQQLRSFYKSLLQNQYNEIEHIVILSGAGTSKGIGRDQKGLTTFDLWNEIEGKAKNCLDLLIKESRFQGKEKDLEKLLSLAGMQQRISPTKRLYVAMRVVKKIIAEKCTLTLPSDAPHIPFLNKVLLRPQKFPRTKIFTLNYDTLFEQAAAKDKFTVIDGFTFSNPRTFNGKYFDYDIIETKHNRQDKKDNTIPKLFYLLKMHGSLNWRRNKKNSEIEQFDGESIDVDDSVMIFPKDSKYEHSYEQPYFEMMARFQQALRTENTLLITIGFSFLDKHISSVILESIKQNPSLNLITFTYPEIVASHENAKEYQKELHNIIAIQSRVTLVAETFEELANHYLENIAHNRFDLLEELNENLKKVNTNGDK